MGEITHGAMLIGALACTACSLAGWRHARALDVAASAAMLAAMADMAFARLAPHARLGVDTRRRRDRTWRTRARDQGSSPRRSCGAGRPCHPRTAPRTRIHRRRVVARGHRRGRRLRRDIPSEHACSRLGERIRRRRRSDRTRRLGRLARGATPAPRAPRRPACSRSGEPDAHARRDGGAGGARELRRSEDSDFSSTGV